MANLDHRSGGRRPGRRRARLRCCSADHGTPSETAGAQSTPASDLANTDTADTDTDTAAENSGDASPPDGGFPTDQVDGPDPSQISVPLGPISGGNEIETCAAILNRIREYQRITGGVAFPRRSDRRRLGGVRGRTHTLADNQDWVIGSSNT